jgi:hypothetical protein
MQVALNSGLVDIKKADMEPLAVQDLSEVGKNYSAKTIQRSCFGFEFGANVPDSRTYLDDNVWFSKLLC